MSGASTHGYSGKPLYQKLGLKPGMVCLLIGAPIDYLSLVEGSEGVTFKMRAASADCVHLFCPGLTTLKKKVDAAIGKVGPGGMLWVSWPKKSSGQFIDLTENHLREIILPKNWVDVKVCAVNQDWSALKFVRRKS